MLQAAAAISPRSPVKVGPQGAKKKTTAKPQQQLKKKSRGSPREAPAEELHAVDDLPSPEAEDAAGIGVPPASPTPVRVAAPLDALLQASGGATAHAAAFC